MVRCFGPSRPGIEVHPQIEGLGRNYPHARHSSTPHLFANHVANAQPMFNIYLLSWSMISISFPSSVRVRAVGRQQDARPDGGAEDRDVGVRLNHTAFRAAQIQSHFCGHSRNSSANVGRLQQGRMDVFLSPQLTGMRAVVNLTHAMQLAHGRGTSTQSVSALVCQAPDFVRVFYWLLRCVDTRLATQPQHRGSQFSVRFPALPALVPG